MAFLEIKNVAVKGIAGAVPKNKELVSDIYIWEGATQFIESTGINERRKSVEGTTSADLCFEAANRLITDLNWEKDDVEVLIFVTQTPDYILPATSCLLQNRLGLSKSCLTLDISLGCSGWVYALSVITALMQNGSVKKGLLLAGDTITKICSSKDKSTYPLFGDAGTAIALEFIQGSPGFRFLLNSDGKGYETIMVKDGGFRNPVTAESLIMESQGNDIERNGLQLSLDGMDVFAFGISKAPKSVKELCNHFEVELQEIDLFTFHQANLKMNEMIRKKLKLPEEKVPYSMDEFGNTSCASIPLTLVSHEANRLRNERLVHLACGFGVGLSWGSVLFETDKIVVPDLIEI